ncbi:MAG: UDP-N-acetylenolpyruvoylglucosamine reductase, partial [Flavobacteriales bacterium]|nr:UDP-N-acetylenolpyruvoylglucosamine reductase [Flavobacteriales bacterium]
LEAYHIHDRHLSTFTLADCRFGYRESVFKNVEKDRWIITSVTLKLTKRPVFQIQYGAISEELEKIQSDRLTIKDVAQAVINIRSSKLPNPALLGNAGSFFKNPVVAASTCDAIRRDHPNMPAYPVDKEHVKLAAGWLIEQAGWKGKRMGKCGVHDRQALVLVNYGGASGDEIYKLSEEVCNDVKNKFGVELEREVNIIA